MLQSIKIWYIILRDLYLRLKVKFDVTNEFLRYDFLLKGNVHLGYFHVSCVYFAQRRCYRPLKLMILCMTLISGSRSIWHYQWIPQMWFPIDIQYRSYVDLTPIIRVLQAAVAVFNVFLYVSYLLSAFLAGDNVFTCVCLFVCLSGTTISQEPVDIF